MNVEVGVLIVKKLNACSEMLPGVPNLSWRLRRLDVHRCSSSDYNFYCHHYCFFEVSVFLFVWYVALGLIGLGFGALLNFSEGWSVAFRVFEQDKGYLV